MMDLSKITRSNDHRRIDVDGRILVAHQAEFMPWLGFISKAAMGDLYLILDDTQFKKKNYQNRNRIRFPNKEGWIWLNAPVMRKDTLPNMMDVEFADDNWRQKQLETIKISYSKAPFFESIFPEILEIYLDGSLNKLVDFNIKIIKYAFQKFDINIPVFRVSNLKELGNPISGFKTDLVISLAKSTNANVLVAGQDGRKYLKINDFLNNKIKLVFQEFNHPSYNQIHGGFVPYMSFIDLLFNHGDEAINILPKSFYTR